MERGPPWEEIRYLRMPHLLAKGSHLPGFCRCRGTVYSLLLPWPWLLQAAQPVPACCKVHMTVKAEGSSTR